MERIYIKDLSKKVGQQVVIKGFAQVIRNQGKIAFIMVRDVTDIIQCVVIKSVTPEAFSVVDSLSLESVLEITGLVKEEKQAPKGIEIQVENIKVLSRAQPELPIPVTVEKSGEETEVTKRFDWRWIDLRKSNKTNIFKVWTELEKGFREYYNANNYIQIYTPSLMTSPSESGAEVFEVKYFDRKAYLAQSPQFYKQAAMASGFEKVFMVGPVFRAEPSYTTRHVTEFTGWDFEISYIDSHYEVMSELENVVISGFKKVKETLLPDLVIPTKPFPKISMAQAKEKLKKNGIKGERPFDVNPEEEKALYEIILKETGSEFYFLTDYPIEARPFYHMRYEDNNKLTKSFDLMYKGLEITTGAQREHRPEFLEKQAVEKGLTLEGINYYIDFFRYGCPPHGGVGIGPGRVIMKMLDLPSVKEAALFPRDVKRLTP